MTNDSNTTYRCVTAVLGRLLLVCLATLASCGSYEDKRIREMKHEKGFGSRANGDATRENYLGGFDVVQFIVPPEALVAPSAEQLAALGAVRQFSLVATPHLRHWNPPGQTSMAMGI